MASPVDSAFLNITGDRKVAYRKTNGSSSPTIVFAPGFMSNMRGRKATTLQKFCIDNDLSYVRFDYEGIGESPGDVKTLHLRNWVEDLRHVIEKLTSGPVLLVGSSLGGWMSIRVALQMPERIQGMVLIAPALNFFIEKYHLIYNGVSDDERAILDRGECLMLNGPYGEIFIRKEYSDQSQEEHVDLSKPIPLKMPIRLIHGMQDPDVPYKRSLNLISQFESDDVDFILRKCGEHQMSEETDLELILTTIKLLISPISLSKL
ncbi:palmitoyl-protein thioesterase ABHD10, mitochondrial-like isoform X2 [Ischnura elegans]|nr:palmitoyl-protein thioesterase ABHD10, mitochondrial-like isoform X2 [Ischnura elegans]XP_046394248.1 palmitoyl-protein thioesterase ABHD10, mitochondrial-like isoform X2 [Ischnura elegans]XP_046394249.1 palmitoyl-protein thioesterase ABHD10, mitochondrial-like isoform X2 [Ischnura elegans]XP_046394250.1 palmitoyl-protein thioesterase ABHD10, mitochondrial-like isoform X2 [Ischnura elegans]XP_046394251.1 palmitoyl-protein thioesterase ABHD10, mitochondrial-like isoform X2 [Ischnura elegans]